MSPVFLKFLIRRHRMSTLLFGFLPMFIGVVVGLLYPTYSKERNLVKLLKYTTRFFGGDKLDMFSPDGAFSMPFQHPLVLIAYAVLPAIVAMGVPAGDRGTKGLDLMLATPLSRRKLGWSVWLYQTMSAAYLALMTLVAASAAGLIAGEYASINHEAFLALAFVGFLLMSTFGALAMIVSVLARDRGQATLTYGIFVAGFFLIDVTSRMWKSGDWLGWFTPYGYLRPSRVLSANTVFSGALARDLIILATVCIVGHLLASWLHCRRKSA